MSLDQLKLNLVSQAEFVKLKGHSNEEGKS